MKLRTTTNTLLLFVFLGIAHFLPGQVQYEFLLKIPVMDSSNSNQPCSPAPIWVEAHPSFSGMFYASGYFTQTGLLEDSVYIYGPGSTLLWVTAIDCHGDTVHMTVPIDSTMNLTTQVADTFFLCDPSYNTCTANFTINGPPGGTSYTFTGQPVGAGAIDNATYLFGDGSWSSGVNASHTYVNSGNYWVTFEVNWATGCHSTHLQQITVSTGIPVCSTAILASQWGNATNFYVNHWSSGTPVNFDWDFGDGQTVSTSTNGYFHNYAANGTYTPCVVTTFSDGCTDSTCSTYNITLGSSGTCNAWFAQGTSGLTATFQDSTTATGPVNSWWWDFGDGAVDSTTGSTVNHTYASPGTYNVTLEIFTTDTCYDVVTRAVTVGSGGACSASFTHAPDTSGQYTILAYNTSTGNNLSYLWNFGDGSTSAQPYPTHQYAGPGTYNICLAVTQTSPACTDTFCDSVTITQKQLMAFTFGVWNPATQVVPDPPTALNQLELYPNPASNVLHIRLPEGAHQEVQISNTLGQIVMRIPAPLSGEMQLDLSRFPDGMYLVRVGESTERFLIQR